jgi:hypothetical protein
MHRKTAEEMDRSELIGMVHVLQSQVQKLTSPEHVRLYQLGRLHDQTDPVVEEPQPSLWRRMFSRRLTPAKPVRTDVDLDFRHVTLAPR